MISINPSFMKDLKQMDSKLDCFFHPGTEKFIVTYKRATGEPVPVATLAGMEDGCFRQPNTRDLEFIKSGDMSNTTVKDKMSKVANHMEFEREKQRRSSYENIRDRTKDDKIQLQRAFQKTTNIGKGVTGFRQV